MEAGKPLIKILEQEGMPGRTTVNRWVHTIEEFRSMYARARELLADFLAEETLVIAAGATGGRYGGGPAGAAIG
jgi:hypothetical protein